MRLLSSALPQVWFALSSAQVFSRTDLTTDSERFYSSVLELLDDPEEKDEVDQLLVWWNRYARPLFCIDRADDSNSQVFPLYTEVERLPSKDSALARIRRKRAEINHRDEIEIV
jgi:hypothetical protein